MLFQSSHKTKKFINNFKPQYCMTELHDLSDDVISGFSNYLVNYWNSERNIHPEFLYFINTLDAVKKACPPIDSLNWNKFIALKSQGVYAMQLMDAGLAPKVTMTPPPLIHSLALMEDILYSNPSSPTYHEPINLVSAASLYCEAGEFDTAISLFEEAKSTSYPDKDELQELIVWAQRNKENPEKYLRRIQDNAVKSE